MPFQRPDEHRPTCRRAPLRTPTTMPAPAITASTRASGVIGRASGMRGRQTRQRSATTWSTTPSAEPPTRCTAPPPRRPRAACARFPTAVPGTRGAPRQLMLARGRLRCSQAGALDTRNSNQEQRQSRSTRPMLAHPGGAAVAPATTLRCGGCRARGAFAGRSTAIHSRTACESLPSCEGAALEPGRLCGLRLYGHQLGGSGAPTPCSASAHQRGEDVGTVGDRHAQRTDHDD